MQHCIVFRRRPVTAGNPLLNLGFYNPAHAAISASRSRSWWAVCGPSLAQAILAASSAQGSEPRGCCAAQRSPRPSGHSGIPAHLLAAISRVESGRRDPGHRRRAPLAMDRERRGPGRFLRHQGRGGGRGPRHAGERGPIDRCRLRADQPDAPPGRLPEPGTGVRPAGECRLCGTVPQGASRANRRLERRRRRCITRRRRSSARSTSSRCWWSGRRSSGSPACGSDAAGPCLGRHDRHAPARLFACAAHAAAGDGSRTAEHHAATAVGEAPPAAARYLPGSADRSRLPATTVAPRRRVASGARIRLRIAAECSPIAGTGPKARGPSPHSTGGAASETGPFGVATVVRRNAGWRENAATSLTKP